MVSTEYCFEIPLSSEPQWSLARILQTLSALAEPGSDFEFFFTELCLPSTNVLVKSQFEFEQG